MGAKLNSPVVIFGSGRSGTTWVQDALAKANDYATVFEPLHPDAVPGAERFANLYVRPGTRNPDLTDYMRAALDGTRAPLWTALRTRPDRLRPELSMFTSIGGLRHLRATYAKAFTAWHEHGRRRNRPKVVKFIRANLLADWLVGEFDVRGAVLVRHPCAVLSSVFQRKGNEWEEQAIANLLHRYLTQSRLIEDRLHVQLAAVQKMRGFVAQHTAVWCIENAAFLDPASATLPVVYYEDLVTSPDTEWARLTRLVGLTRVPDKGLRERPSQQASYKAMREASNHGFLSGWLETLRSAQLEEVRRVLEVFEVASYDVQDAMPLRSSNETHEASTARGTGETR